MKFVILSVNNIFGKTIILK